MIPILSVLRQSMLIPAPPLTEKNLGSLAGKTVLVTGGNSGVGFDLCAILYGAGARVFLAGRNETSGREAIDKIKAQAAASPAAATTAAAAAGGGELEFLQLDLSDLSSIKASAEDFLGRADALHFLCNNAGVMQPPKGSKGKQGHELQVVTNCLGTYLFTDLITPRLVETARAEKAKGEENGVRVAWAGSSAIDVYSPRDGVRFEKDGDDGLERQAVLGPTPDYGQSKTGNLFMATAYGERVAKDGIVSTCFNPGNLWTNLTRHVVAGVPAGISNFFHRLILYPSIYGAYTELYCGFGRDLTVADNGAFIAPWGRKWYVRGDIERSRTGELRTRYMEYVEREIKAYR